VFDREECLIREADLLAIRFFGAGIFFFMITYRINKKRSTCQLAIYMQLRRTSHEEIETVR
jgi:hypothetical protein